MTDHATLLESSAERVANSTVLRQSARARKRERPTVRPRCAHRRLLRLHRRYSGASAPIARCGAAWRRWRSARNQRVSGFLKRSLDVSLAVIGLLASAPFVLPAILILRLFGVRPSRIAYVGRGVEPIYVLQLPESSSRRWSFGGFLNLTLVLLNVLRGDMSIVGPRPLRPEELDLADPAGRRRCSDRPGLLCLWWIRRRTNIDYGREVEADAEYVDRFSFRSDLAIMFRAMIAYLYGEPAEAIDAKTSILGVPVDNVSMTEAVDQLVHFATQEDRCRQVCFVNADCANHAYRDTDYRSALAKADAVYPDGIGMKLAARVLKGGVRQNVNGTDMFPRLCERLAENRLRIFLLGAKPGVARTVRDWIQSRYKEVEVCGTQHGYFSDMQQAQVLERIRAAKPHVLLVAFGAPKQDLWIAENLDKAGACVALGVGGLFDFYSGNVPRAPLWLRELGMEWAWRLGHDPRRMWKRYLAGNLLFLARVFRERIRQARLERSQLR